MPDDVKEREQSEDDELFELLKELTWLDSDDFGPIITHTAQGDIKVAKVIAQY